MAYHIFINCYIAKKFCLDMGINISLINTFHIHWLVNLKSLNPPFYEDYPDWLDIFLFAIWHLWLNRNQSVLKNKQDFPRYSYVLRRTIEYISCTLTPSNHLNNISINIKWLFSMTGYFKLNIDGVFSPTSDRHGISGLI